MRRPHRASLGHASTLPESWPWRSDGGHNCQQNMLSGEPPDIDCDRRMSRNAAVASGTKQFRAVARNLRPARGYRRSRRPANAAGSFRNGQSGRQDTDRPAPCSGHTPCECHRENPQKTARAGDTPSHALFATRADRKNHHRASLVGSGSRSHSHSCSPCFIRMAAWPQPHRPAGGAMAPHWPVSTSTLKTSLLCFPKSPGILGHRSGMTSRHRLWSASSRVAFIGQAPWSCREE